MSSGEHFFLKPNRDAHFLAFRGSFRGMEIPENSGEGGAFTDPLQAWAPGEVWFRRWIPEGLPWGNEELLEAVPESAAGCYGVKVGAYTRRDGQRYEPGELVVVDTREEFERLLQEFGSSTDLVFPWYGRLVPASLLAPHSSRVDLAGYRAEFGGRFLKSLLLTAGLVALGFAMPDLLMLALLMATFYGLFPLVESAMAWVRRVDLLSVEELNRRLVNFEFFRRWLVNRRSRLLKVGVGALVAVFVAQMLAGLSASIEAAALVKSRVLDGGEWWRVVTTGLMHGNVVHILFNGMALYSLGRVIVALVSPSLLGSVFLFTVVSGSCASLWMGPGEASVGASGGILGCLGFLLVVTGKYRRVLPGYLRASLLQSTFVVAIFGLLGAGFIDNAAHAGGFLGGLLLGFVLSPWIELAPRKSRPLARLFSAASLSVLAAGVVKIFWELWLTRAG